MRPKISVAVPAYNRERLLARALNSVLAQTCHDFECVVSDNRSTDGTLAIAHEYARRDPRIRVLQMSENLGPVRNWLKAVEACKAELVKILFSDDWLEPDCLAQCFAAFDSSPGIGFVYFDARLEGDDGRPSIRPSGQESGLLFLWRAMVSHRDVPVSPTAGVFRRNDLIDALRTPINASIDFDYPGTGAGPDQLVYLRAADKFRKVHYINKVMAHYGYNTCSITVKESEARPGYLMRGYLFAQLAFLSLPSRRSLFVTAILRAGVCYHIAFLLVKQQIKRYLRSQR